jgi:hypothetical protein
MWNKLTPKYEFKQYVKFGKTVHHQTVNLKLAHLIRLTGGFKRHEEGFDWSGSKMMVWSVQDKTALSERYQFRESRLVELFKWGGDW